MRMRKSRKDRTHLRGIPCGLCGSYFLIQCCYYYTYLILTLYIYYINRTIRKDYENDHMKLLYFCPGENCPYSNDLTVRSTANGIFFLLLVVCCEKRTDLTHNTTQHAQYDRLNKEVADGRRKPQHSHPDTRLHEYSLIYPVYP